MTFRETLDRHLSAIGHRDLAALREMLRPDDLTLIMADGRLVRTVQEFLEPHQGWFAETTWSLTTKMINVIESPEIGVAVLHLDYRDNPPGRPPVHEQSYLSLVFASREGRWVIVQDQNTPIKLARRP
jgi:hypothetical protein